MRLAFGTNGIEYIHHRAGGQSLACLRLAKGGKRCSENS